MIKVAYIIDTIYSPNAGTEGQLLMLLNNLDRSRVEPYLVCLHDSEWLSKQSFDFGYSIIDFNKILSFDTPRFISQFKELHKQERFDIVQVFFIDANIIGVMAAKSAGIKGIIASRRNAGDRHSALQMNALRFLRRYTTKYLANSEGIARTTMELEGAPREQIEVIYNGMYLDKFKKMTPEMRSTMRREWEVGEDDILVGLVGNLRAVKNIESLIDAAARLQAVNDKVRFVVVGEGGRRESLQGKINDAGLTQRFKLVGRYGDVIPCLAAFDIGVLCSKAEGFSNSIIEYMAAGLPVVASDVGGNKEAVEHKKTGYIYSLSDPDGLFVNLSKLIESKELISLMGDLGREKAMANYDVSKYIESHHEFYERVTGLNNSIN